MVIATKTTAKNKTFCDSDLEMFEQLDQADLEFNNIKSSDLITLEKSYSNIQKHMSKNLVSNKVAYV